jgi:hypothetical protein
MSTASNVMRAGIVVMVLGVSVSIWIFRVSPVWSQQTRNCPGVVNLADSTPNQMQSVALVDEFLKLNGSIGFADVLGERLMVFPSEGVHFIYQLPLRMSVSSSENVSSYLLSHRLQEYVKSVAKTLENPSIACVHLMTESAREQLLIYDLFHSAVHARIRTFNLNKRMTFADAVLYSSRFLKNRVVAISTSDTSAIGDSWSRLTPANMQNQLFGLTRHERPGCSMTCDCNKHFDGCHDTFVFLAPLGGGDVLLEQISFRVGGLWGSENRFLWEVQKVNPSIIVSNPCRTLKMEHSHCVAAGKFRPSQDQRRVNVEGKSLAPGPDVLRI